MVGIDDDSLFGREHDAERGRAEQRLEALISPLDATVQIPMVTKATGISAAKLRALIVRETHGAQFGFLGSAYVDVLQLNEGLAALQK